MPANDVLAVLRFSPLRLAVAVKCLAFGILLLAAFARAQVPDTLLQTILPAPKTLQSGAAFGSSVAVDGGYIVVGAPLDDSVGEDSGAVKVFDSTTGALHLVLLNPSQQPGDRFGFAVAISGTRVVVGAYGAEDERNGGRSDAGIVYVYDLAGAVPSLPAFTLKEPVPRDDHKFGYMLAISGTRIVVGLRPDNDDSTQPGRVYVFDLNSPAPTKPFITLNADGSRVGSVAISGTRVLVAGGGVKVYDVVGATPDVPILNLNNSGSMSISGATVVIGAPLDDNGAIDAGSAFIYNLDSATPTVPVLTLHNPEPMLKDRFGWSVSISGMRLVVGTPLDDTGATDAGRAYVYDLSSATPAVPATILNNPTPATDDQFGSAVAIDAARVVAGAPNDDTGARDAGSVYVYDLAGVTPVVVLNNPGETTLDHFGHAVAVSGALMVVGVPNSDVGAEAAGSAYVYDLSSATATVPVATLNNPAPANGTQFGYSVAIDGTRIVIGTYADAAYIYDLSSSTPTLPLFKLTSPVTTTLPGAFGSSVAVSGTRVLVGAPSMDIGSSQEGWGAGGAYVFDLASATPTVPVTMIPNPILRLGGPRFGSSVAISGTSIVIGAPFDTLNLNLGFEGSAYIYDLSSANPEVPLATLSQPSPRPGALFGYSVSVSGMRAVIGAYGFGAWVYDLGRTGRNSVPAFTLSPPAGAGRFGAAVAISDLRVIVGAQKSNLGAGNAYIYDLNGSSPTQPVAMLTNPRPSANDNFGWSVAIDGTTVAIGTPFEDPREKLDRGAAYVYGPNSTATPPTATDGLLAFWKLAHFGTTAGHGPLEDDDRDGLNNLLEEAFNTDPLKPDATAAPAVVNEAGYLTLTITKHPGVTYQVQSAATPEDAAFSAATTTVLLDNPTTLKVRDNFPIGTPPTRFLRIKVTAAP